MFYNTSSYNWSGYTILIVEDDASSAFYLKEVLKYTQIKILHVADGQHAIDMCRINPTINLILMDIKLPVVNGYEATREIKNLYPDIPIIAQTADATYNHRNLCIKAGCNDFIAKPIDSADLLLKINAFLK